MKPSALPVLVDQFLAELAKEGVVVHYKGQFLWYQDERYQFVPDEFIYDKWITFITKKSKWSAQNFSSGKTVIAKVARERLPAEQKMPAFIGETEINHNVLNFKNGLYNLATKGLMDHTDKWLSVTRLPYDFDSTAEAPRWEAFLDEIFEGDQERIDLLQEWFGYALTPDTSQHRALVLYGVPRSGKSTVVRVLSEMLGMDNVSNVRLELFGERFQLMPTAHKLMNISEEADRTMHFHEAIFKSFVAGEELQLEKKGADPVTVKTTARLLVVANDTIPFQDTSGAVPVRLLVLPFNLSFADKENRELAKELLEELPGIFNWALEGRERLKAQGTFTVAVAGQEAKREFMEDNNPLIEWVSKYVKPSPGKNTSFNSAYEAYHAWCSDNGVQHPISKRKLTRKVRQVLAKPRSWGTVKSNSVAYWPDVELPGEWDTP